MGWWGKSMAILNTLGPWPWGQSCQNWRSYNMNPSFSHCHSCQHSAFSCCVGRWSAGRRSAERGRRLWEDFGGMARPAGWGQRRGAFLSRLQISERKKTTRSFVHLNSTWEYSKILVGSLKRINLQGLRCHKRIILPSRSMVFRLSILILPGSIPFKNSPLVSLNK